MPDISEDLLQLIWQHRLLKPGPYTSTGGRKIEIINTGQLNRDAGPDFFNAGIRVDNVLLAGNIEVHVRSSHWLKHGHQFNPSYNTIILHVVYEHDEELKQNSDFGVEVLELKEWIDPHTLATYASLTPGSTGLPCSGQLNRVKEISLKAWLERMAVERLENKVQGLTEIAELCKGDYNQVFYYLLLKYYGSPVNSFPFEMLARQLPYTLLLKHAGQSAELEALLLGLCGMLDEPFEEPYLRHLQNEFEFLKTKYRLAPLDKTMFKFSRMRPANFPTVRLAQFAAVIHQHPGLLSHPLSFTREDLLNTVLSAKPQGYWSRHYREGSGVTGKTLAPGKNRAEMLLLNVFAPFLFFYGNKTANEALKKKALDWMESCSFENNAKTRLFAPVKPWLLNGAHSQALLNLVNNYCSQKRCLNCGIGLSLLKPPA